MPKRRRPRGPRGGVTRKFKRRRQRGGFPLLALAIPAALAATKLLGKIL